MKNPLHLRFQSGFLPLKDAPFSPVYWPHENGLNCPSRFSNFRSQTLGHSNSTASNSKASFFSFPFCELLRPAVCKWCRNNTFTYNVSQNSALRYPRHPRLEVVHSQPRTGCRPHCFSCTATTCEEETRFNSRRKRALCASNQLCIRRFFFFLRKVMWREEPAWKQQTSARSLFQYNLEKMTDLGWSCCQKRWLKRSKPEMEIRRMPEAWKKNKLSRYDWLDGFKINCTKDELG